MRSRGTIVRTAGAIHCHISRTAAIDRRKLIPVGTCRMVVVELILRRFDVVLVHGHAFLGIGLGGYASGTIKGSPVDYGGIDDRAVDIGIVHDGGIYIHHGGIVAEMAALPGASDEAYASVAEAIVDPSIEADVRTPVTPVPAIDAAGITPVSGSP